jgi:hypothetical protein
MDITLRYFDGCPNWTIARDRLLEAIGRAGIDTPIRVERVDSPDDAERLRFLGSPTILIDGRDPFAYDSEDFGLTCRMYETERGLEGSPSLERLLEVLSRGRPPRST